MNDSVLNNHFCCVMPSFNNFFCSEKCFRFCLPDAWGRWGGAGRKDGERMEGGWRESGGKLEGRWRQAGRRLEGSWRDDGGREVGGRRVEG